MIYVQELSSCYSSLYEYFTVQSSYGFEIAVEIRYPGVGKLKEI